jgi:hypothetical protein
VRNVQVVRFGRGFGAECGGVCLAIVRVVHRLEFDQKMGAYLVEKTWLIATMKGDLHFAFLDMIAIVVKHV